MSLAAKCSPCALVLPSIGKKKKSIVFASHACMFVGQLLELVVLRYSQGEGGGVPHGKLLAV